MKNEIEVLKTDTGQTEHYLRLIYAKILQNIKSTKNGPLVCLTNNYTIHTVLKLNVPMTNVPSISIEAHVSQYYKVTL